MTTWMTLLLSIVGMLALLAAAGDLVESYARHRVLSLAMTPCLTCPRHMTVLDRHLCRFLAATPEQPALWTWLAEHDGEIIPHEGCRKQARRDEGVER